MLCHTYALKINVDIKIVNQVSSNMKICMKGCLVAW